MGDTVCWLSGKQQALILLYYSARLYRIVPSRALTDQAAQFRALVRTKLRRYDYRNPSAPAQTKLMDSPQPVS